MEKNEVISRIETYLKVNNIPYIEDSDNGIPRITMIYHGYEKCPDEVIESCIWFYDSEMEVRIYYDENASNFCKNSQNIQELYRLLNYINAKVWTRTTRNIFKNQHLYTSRIYLSEDNSYDIMMTTVINYDFFYLKEFDTLDYITIYCPKLMNELSPIIFGILLDNLTNNEAIAIIENNIIQETKESIIN